jgi:hypothetical protein
MIGTDAKAIAEASQKSSLSNAEKVALRKNVLSIEKEAKSL